MISGPILDSGYKIANAVSALDDLICPTERSRAVSTFPTKWGAKELLGGSQPHSNFFSKDLDNIKHTLRNQGLIGNFHIIGTN